MYKILMSLPLFNGIGHDEISKIAESTKLHFLKYRQGESIVTLGEPCSHIKFIISGCVQSTITSQDGGFSISQILDAPNVIMPDFMFGRSTQYPCTVTALQPTGILQISKADYMTILSSDKIFMFNFLNILSGNSQKAIIGAFANTIEQQIALKVVALTQSQGRDIIVKCADLAAFLNTTQQQLNSTLESLKQRKIIDYNPTEITVLSRTDLINLLITNQV